jgi:hypothetical protein
MSIISIGVTLIFLTVAFFPLFFVQTWIYLWEMKFVIIVYSRYLKI